MNHAEAIDVLVNEIFTDEVGTALFHGLCGSDPEIVPFTLETEYLYGKVATGRQWYSLDLITSGQVTLNGDYSLDYWDLEYLKGLGTLATATGFNGLVIAIDPSTPFLRTLTVGISDINVDSFTKALVSYLGVKEGDILTTVPDLPALVPSGLTTCVISRRFTSDDVGKAGTIFYVPLIPGTGNTAISLNNAH